MLSVYVLWTYKSDFFRKQNTLSYSLKFTLQGKSILISNLEVKSNDGNTVLGE
jgi:hypothetical protein